jgi:uncharacterized membrane protein HdeD (DUF308 family)
MKTVRYFAAVLMFATGVMHILPMFKSPREENALPMLFFGLAFLLVCVLLIMNQKRGPVAGILFTLVGLATGFFMIGVKNWTTMLTIMFIIDAVVLICCILLLVYKEKPKIAS